MRRYHVERFIGDKLLLYFPDNFEDYGFEVVVSVGPYSKVDLARIGVIVVCDSDADDGVGGSHRHLCEDVGEPNLFGQG